MTCRARHSLPALVVLLCGAAVSTLSALINGALMVAPRRLASVIE